MDDRWFWKNVGFYVNLAIVATTVFGFFLELTRAGFKLLMIRAVDVSAVFAITTLIMFVLAYLPDLAGEEDDTERKTRRA